MINFDDFIKNASVELSVDLGRFYVDIPLSKYVSLGKIIDLDNRTDEPLSLRVKNKIIADGLILIKDYYCFLVTQIHNPIESVRGFFTTVEPDTNPNQVSFYTDTGGNLSVKLGKTLYPVNKLLSLRPNIIVILDKPTSEPLNVFYQGKIIAKCNLLISSVNYRIMITDIVENEFLN